ncbi:MAG TPA: FAD-dependent oxidoreductase [Gemmatimonadaceae bacterium]|nr:FAD-dependent oxidoreductase [Gemmatimonadaceae bacterium]
MGGESTPLTGPDLEHGIAEGDLAPGAMLVGHARGEQVLLARVGEEVMAVGATCTHWSGPLGDGLLVGDTVRCPWHHACFSLRTGEAVRAPALSPVACWRVERRDGTIRVTGKVEGREAARSTRRGGGSPDAPLVIAIVGAGGAGNAAAEMLRRLGYAGRVLLIGDEETVPYDRPNLSKDYLAGKAKEEWIPLRPPEFYGERAIELMTGCRATAIEPARREIMLADGRAVGYDRLLLATGAEPVRLRVPGHDRGHVHVLRTLDDSRAIIAACDGAKHAVVVGASFIGLEVAASLRERGLEVAVVAPEQVPLERVFGSELGSFVRRVHEEHGVAFQLGETLAAVGAADVTLSSGRSLPADLVVVGIGVKPRVELAADAGLAVDGGVLVNARLESSVRGIFAAGDIARFPYGRTGERLRVEHWVVAERQGQVAARGMLGEPASYDDAPFFWSQHYDVAINYTGHHGPDDAISIAGSLDARDATAAWRRDGRIVAVATVGRDRDGLRAEVALERGEERTLEAIAAGSTV